MQLLLIAVNKPEIDRCVGTGFGQYGGSLLPAERHTQHPIARQFGGNAGSLSLAARAGGSISRLEVMPPA